PTSLQMNMDMDKLTLQKEVSPFAERFLSNCDMDGFEELEVVFGKYDKEMEQLRYSHFFDFKKENTPANTR
ncbi:MAG: hypothetical protein KDB98_14345, partial [Flavobacteriales bacterium]|nr:hypothetical protein [Flavobacteriales bacterium]